MTTSAEARVVAAFTFIVALMLGAWNSLHHLLTGPSSLLPDSELGRLGLALLPFAAAGVAWQAANAAEAAWARVLGSAAVLLGALAGVGGVLYFLAYT